jgi:hypothetical protein
MIACFVWNCLELFGLEWTLLDLFEPYNPACHDDALQLHMAASVPGKEEFWETLRYFNKQLELHNVKVLPSLILLSDKAW